ncbi:HK97 family phage prohead protease [Dyadobacter sp. CY345]|uniref:HK97 family phage prohead protease n=1 Tax=Dyadobacter sp. CY345 TaxID=2909335 RepID=UPI001F37C817|nr:HK97 family phage prohead protease [Dyadobacter sp. CY345]MCF2443646.1 HK97 family phage prohead protease [Dyadobacter sp. CY345]
MVQEKRVLPQNHSEVRAVQSTDGIWHIPGKGIVFNQRSRKLGFFYEIIDPKALDGANMSDAISCFNHDMNHILGNVRNKTTSFTVTAEAMEYDTLPPDNQTTKDIVIAPILRGDVTGSSFMFSVAERGGDEWVEEPNGDIIRYVRKIDVVYEWGPVSMPAYLTTSTDVAKRSFDYFINENKKQELQLRSTFAKMQLELYR